MGQATLRKRRLGIKTYKKGQDHPQSRKFRKVGWSKLPPTNQRPQFPALYGPGRNCLQQALMNQEVLGSPWVVQVGSVASYHKLLGEWEGYIAYHAWIRNTETGEIVDPSFGDWTHTNHWSKFPALHGEMPPECLYWDFADKDAQCPLSLLKTPQVRGCSLLYFAGLDLANPTREPSRECMCMTLLTGDCTEYLWEREITRDDEAATLISEQKLAAIQTVMSGKD